MFFKTPLWKFWKPYSSYWNLQSVDEELNSSLSGEIFHLQENKTYNLLKLWRDGSTGNSYCWAGGWCLTVYKVHSLEYRCLDFLLMGKYFRLVIKRDSEIQRPCQTGKPTIQAILQLQHHEGHTYLVKYVGEIFSSLSLCGFLLPRIWKGLWMTHSLSLCLL